MDVIAAIATGSAATAIGIVRVSGDGCFALCGRVFRAAGGRPFAAQEPRKMVFGEMLDRAGRVIDRGLAVRFPGPGSYTGEDCAEFHCHGSPVVLRELLSALFAAGARQAQAGEFTKRAFLNGKLDLTQAEAVADLLEAETPAAVRQAAGQLSGALSRRVAALYDGLVDLMAHFHAVLDYPDEDIDPFRADTIREGLDAARTGLEALLRTYARGRYIAGGVPCVLIGRPNAGKSSLLNALVGYDRAIVTDVPGTTRDTVEARCRLGGVVLRLIDTAGLRDSDDAVEQLGVERSRAALERAEQNEGEVTRQSERYGVVGVHMFCPSTPDAAAHCRNFAPLYAIPEEAATGTSNGALTYYLYRRGLTAAGAENRFVQGEKMGKPSEILSRLTDGGDGVKVQVGGRAVLALRCELL